MAWLIGGGLLAAPAEIGDAIRAAVRDALGPGQSVASKTPDAIRELCSGRSAVTASDESATLRSERDLWRNRFLDLQSRFAARRDSQHSPAPLASAETEPLIVPDLVEARLLGVERDPLRERMSRLLNRGGTDGIAVDDIVLSDSFPLLDIGTDERIEPDMPVVSGGSVLGRIRHCGRWTCTMQPITDPAFRAFVQIIRPTSDKPLAGAEGVLAGDGAGACRMELVDATQPVSVGDFIYGRPVDFDGPPPCYGRITAAELADGAAHWTITVTPTMTVDACQRIQIRRELPNPARIADAGGEPGR